MTRGLATPKGYVFAGRISPLLHLGLVSEHYVGSPSDVGSYRPTGFTPWTTPDEPLPADVEAFLDAGDPPVLVTLGTSAAASAPQLFGMAAAALDRIGARGLFLTGTAANAVGLGDRPGVWPFVPLGPVLARCRAALHSGSHGTNALVLEAGLPAVIVPQLFDQVWHGRRVTDLGLGRLVRKPTVDSITEALRAITGDPSYSARAVAFARGLAEEDGAVTAADLIESLPQLPSV
jgi:UDP:flavonoid glycosyltransferase YjiC (YdhE family)